MVSTTRSRARPIRPRRLSRTSASDPEVPGVRTLVEVADHGEHALVAERLQLVGHRERADQRRRVELPIPGVQDVAEGGAQRERMAFGDRMGHAQQAAVERADPNALAGLDDMNRHALEIDVLELAAQEGGGEARAPDRAAQPLPEVGDGAKVILMGVGQDQAAEILAPLGDEARVGQDDLDPRQGLVGEADAQIDHQPLAVEAVEVEVQAELPGAPKGREQKLSIGHGCGPQLCERGRSA